MPITIRRHEDRPGAAATRAAAEIDDSIRCALFFTLSRHTAAAQLLHVDLDRSESASGARHRCTITGAVETLGVFRVRGESESLHLAVERALHRLEMWLVRERLAPRKVRTLYSETLRRAA